MSKKYKIHPGIARSRQVRSTKGRNSKKSSKVYCYTIEDLTQEEDELTTFFGQLDAVGRKMAYEGRYDQ